MRVVLAEGSWKIHYLTDEPSWLEDGRFREGDEAFPVPGITVIPSLCVCPSDLACERLVAAMAGWKKTHPPVEATS